MKVAKYYNNHDVRLEEIPIPQIKSGELLVKVIASGICGSDVMEWYRIKKAPIVLGHEIAGEVAEVGESVNNFSAGDRVFVSHHVPCNECYYCLNGNHTVCDTLRSTNFDPGGFAQYIRVPEINVRNGTFLLPDGMTYEEGSFIEPLACVVRGQKRALMKEGQSVLIIGSGLSGLLHIKLARANNARRIVATDINEFRLEAAIRFGADEAIPAGSDVPAKFRELNEGHLADLVIVCAGADKAIAQGLQSVERGGTILLFALPMPETTFPMPLFNLWHDGITMTNTYAAGSEDILKAIDLLGSQIIKVNDMITHRLGLSETQFGFELVAEAKDSLKVIIEPHL